MRKPIEAGPPCPRCGCPDSRRECNFGRPIRDGRWWCLKCWHLWWGETTSTDVRARNGKP